MPSICCNNVSYRYPLASSDALHGISFSAHEGELVGVAGNNGCGKTTLCNILRRFVPDFYKGDLTGEVTLDGRNLSELSRDELARTIGYVSQDPFAQMTGSSETVVDEVSFGLENLGTPLDEVRTRVWDVIRRFGLEGLAERNPLSLSGGQKQKVAIAAVIAMSPEILIVDEPTSQLDPESTRTVLSMLRELRDDGVCVVLVEHKAELLSEVADRIYLLEDGRVVAEGAPRSTYNRAFSDSRRLLFPEPLTVSHEVLPRGFGGELPVRRQEALDLWMGGAQR